MQLLERYHLGLCPNKLPLTICQAIEIGQCIRIDRNPQERRIESLTAEKSPTNHLEWMDLMRKEVKSEESYKMLLDTLLQCDINPYKH